MLIARRAGFWTSRYDVRAGDRPVTTWDARVWRSGGDFTLDGRRYAVRSNAWGNRYAMTDDRGAEVAAADRVGRKHWTVEVGGQTYRFQRASFFSGEQELHNAAGYSSEFIEIWFARGLLPGARALDHGEAIDVFPMEEAELDRLAAAGELTDAKTLIGLLWLQKWRAGRWALNWRALPLP